MKIFFKPTRHLSNRNKTQSMTVIMLLFLLLIQFTACTTPKTGLTTQKTDSPTSLTPVPAIATSTQTPVPLNVDINILPVLKTQKVISNDVSTIASNLIHLDTAKQVDISVESLKVTPSTDSSVSEIVTGNDKDGQRYIWNLEANGWILEPSMSRDWTHPELAPYLQISVFYDGSANLISALYYAEHPEIIPINAVYPYWKVNVLDNYDGSVNFYEISFWSWYHFEMEFSTTDKEAMITKIDEKPYGWAGIFRTKDTGENEIYVLSRVNKNPVEENPLQTTNIFLGLDKATYLDIQKYYLVNRAIYGGEVDFSPAFPPPPGMWGFNQSSISGAKGRLDPYVSALQNQNAITIFSAQEQDEIGTKFDNMFTDNRHNTVSIGSLPSKLGYMIAFTDFYFLPIGLHADSDSLAFIHPNDGESISYNENIDLRLTRVQKAIRYSWEFYQSGKLINKTIYTVSPFLVLDRNSPIFLNLTLGDVEIHASVQIDNQWSNPVVMVIHLK